MKKKLLLAGAVLVMAAAAVTGFSAYNQLDASDLLNANIAALAQNEGGGIAGNEEEYSGWLWKKYWVGCTIVGQIIVSHSSGSISAGTYAYSASLEAALSSSNAVYTVVAGGAGQKSYCYDGWSACWSNDCR